MSGNNYKYGLTTARGISKTIQARRARALDNPKENSLLKLVLQAENQEEK